MAATAVLIAAAVIAGTGRTQDAVANGDTRTLSLIHEHTKESATITFKRDGRYDRAALDQLNWLLRDWRENESIKMDPRLFDTVWEAQRSLGASAPLRVVCGYRSPRTNSMLRARSRGVADQSQHMLGKAMDFFMTDASVDDIRAAGMRLQRGGVGWYPRSGSPFVHLDVGSVRAWPRMTRDQLARLFPDGKTVHLPTDGKPMARYAEARAEVLARGGSVLGQTAVASADLDEEGGGLRGFFAGLFGSAEPAASTPTAQAGLGPNTSRLSRKSSVAIASADPDDATGARQALAYAAPNSSGALRDAMLRRGGQDIPSAKDLLTAETAQPAPGSVLLPMPPRRPTEFATVAATAISAPLPPPRPVRLAALGDLGLPGMAHVAAQPASASASAPQPVPVDTRAQLRTLFETIAVKATQPAMQDAPVRMAAAQVQPVPQNDPSGLFQPAVSLPLARFSEYSPGDGLPASRFSGSAVAALRTQR